MKATSILLFVLCMLAGGSLLSQTTTGGSRKNWEQYSITYDTVMVTETIKSAYPPSGKSYFRAAILNGKGLMAEESRLFFPEDGFRGTFGHDFSRAYELAFGGYGNWTGVNQNLHPALDFSTNWEVSGQFGTPEYGGFEPGYSVDYGLYYNVSFGLGIAATIKPGYFNPSGSEGLKDLFFDLGYRVEAGILGYGESTYSYSSQSSSFSGEIYSEDIGSRLDGNFFIGVRYKFIGLRVDFSNTLTYLATPEITHDWSGGTEVFDLDVDYSFTKLSLMLFF